MICRGVYFFLFCWVLFGCCQQEDLTLTSAAQTWLQAMPASEITFQNANGETITFKTATRYYNQQATDKVCGTYTIESQEITLTTEAEPSWRVQFILSHEVLLTIKSFSTAPSAGNINSQFNTASQQFVSDPWRDRYFKKANLNGKNYAQVLLIYGDAISGNIAFSEIYYAREKGMVSFKTLAGDWYYLQ